MKKIAICGGHLTPALALIEKLEKRHNCQIVFFGRKNAMEGNVNLSAEYRLISQKNIKFIAMISGRLQRKFTKYTIPSLAKVPVGFAQAFYQTLTEKPDIVVSFGGYLSTPVIFASWLLGIDTITHEQAAIPGLANRINSLFVKKIFLAWPQTKDYFPKKKTEVIGNLTRGSIFAKTAKDKRIADFLKRSKNLIFVTGGNQGSHFLNTLTAELLSFLKDFSILHQVGTTNYKGDLQKFKNINKPNYLAQDYLDHENIGAVFHDSKLVVSRSGANTVWDLGVLGKVSILIPLPASASAEQTQNAKILEKAGSAVVIDQHHADVKKILATIRQIFKDSSTYQKKAQEFKRSLPENSTEKVIDYIFRNQNP